MELYYDECKQLFNKHAVTLRIPEVIEKDYYQTFAARFERIMQFSLKAHDESFYVLKDMMRELVVNAKVITVDTIRNQARSLFRRLHSIHI